ncbi:helix-turn-helix transcriptional regulator [Ottowia testudinis]|uniref:WYL domain-containing protein n=1 Tax=Ottowia testudinis TaxID=2816950 RepID=A0A975CEU0_9BURK|nr:WYL domain-containing protein [Ottowia testudinis]QTD44920.1 WYL domain-containing protein [Ottowia testudinis]
MKASRLLSILLLLQAQGRLTAPELARRLEVSVRTILRDVDELSAAGVPLYAERGREGGFQLRAGWSTSLTGLTEAEAHALVLAGLPSAATQLGLGADAASAGRKLLASLGAADRGKASAAAARLHIDPMDWYRAEDEPPWLRPVADAVWRGCCIRVHYQSWRQLQWQVLAPLGLVLKAGVWYLVATRAGEDEPRTFRVSSMQAVQLQEDLRVKRKRRFDLATYWRAATQRFEAERAVLQAHVRLSPRARVWLDNTRTRWVAVPRAQPGRGRHKDWLEALLPVESIEQGTCAVLALGDEAEVLGPPPLRAAMQRSVRQLARRYGVL